MEITCPEHGGIIYVPGNDSISAAVKTLIIACDIYNSAFPLIQISNIITIKQIKLNLLLNRDTTKNT